MTDSFYGIRRNTKGWQQDPPARIHTNILFGSGEMLTKDFIRQHDITHIINCAQEEDCPLWVREEFLYDYYCLNATDSMQSNILDWFPEFERALDSFLQHPKSKTIFIHCQCGINRSGFLSLLYACKKFGHSHDTMVKSILTQRPCALTNPSFKKQAFDYIKKLPVKYNGRSL